MSQTTSSTSSIVGTGLKAERIQIASPVEGKLKAERIQIALRDFPGWVLERNARAMTRVVAVTDGANLGQALRQVADLATAGGPLPEIHVDAETATFSVPTVEVGWLEAESFELAKALVAQG
jgi:pterin-4a-carbinolamine dehydratase